MRSSQGKALAVFLIGGVLAGCGGGSDFADLETFMDEVDSRPKGAIVPLPTFEQIAPFAYHASNMRSPFEPPVLVKRVERAKGGPQVTPNFNRSKQYLEQYTIGTLSMVGTLAQGQAVFALVQDGEGGVHRVQRGDYMGTDHGQIQTIGEAAIELIEIVRDGTGGWIERSRTVNLAGSDRG